MLQGSFGKVSWIWKFSNKSLQMFFLTLCLSLSLCTCSRKQLEPNSYLVPHATLELGLNNLNMKQFEEAKEYLEKAKDYTGYAMEAILHCRLHTAIRTMAEEVKKTGFVFKKNPSGIRSIWSELSRRLTFQEKNDGGDEESVELNDEEEEEEVEEFISKDDDTENKV